MDPEPDPDPDPYLLLTEPDPAGPKTCGSGSVTLIRTLNFIYLSFSVIMWVMHLCYFSLK